MGDGNQVHKGLVGRNQRGKLAGAPAAVTMLKGGSHTGDGSRVEDAKANTIAAKGRVGAAIHDEL
jgi:hypothetical protein